MRIRNDTAYATAPMRAIIARIAKEELNAAGCARLRVVVEYRKRQGWLAAGEDTGVSGHCGYGLLDLPGRPVIRVTHDGVDPIDFAHTVAHEIGHAKGITHRQMRGASRYERVGDYRERYAWAAAHPIAPVATKPKPKPTLDDRLALARRREKEWTTRLRRAETALKKYRRRIREIERRHAASSSAAIAASTKELTISGPGKRLIEAAETASA